MMTTDVGRPLTVAEPATEIVFADGCPAGSAARAEAAIASTARTASSRPPDRAAGLEPAVAAG